MSALCHPSTYIDKVLVGSSQGHLQLWNLKSAKLIYTFAGWSSGVTAPCPRGPGRPGCRARRRES